MGPLPLGQERRAGASGERQACRSSLQRLDARLQDTRRSRSTHVIEHGVDPKGKGGIKGSPQKSLHIEILASLYASQ